MVTINVTPRQAIEQLERDLGLTPQDLCGALNVTRRTLERWRSGEAYPQRESREKLAELTELRDHLQESFIDVESVRLWMHTPARYIGWTTPAEMVRLGKIDRARSVIEVLDSGIFI